jgi:midasin (ATPase involved in ribosome maturation)
MLCPCALHAQERSLADGAGAKPGYNLRTLCRALEYARLALPVYGLQRSLYDGAAMAFLTQLAPAAAPVLERLLAQHLLGGATQLKVPAASCCLILQFRMCFFEPCMRAFTYTSGRG